jgi:DNA polymerase
MHVVTASDFEQWRNAARQCMLSNLAPEDVLWRDGREACPGLFDALEREPAPPRANQSHSPTVPQRFMELATYVAYHRTPGRWPLLYRLLWRLTHETPHLLDIAADDDVLLAARWEKAVRRDAHKMKAFVRFRRITEADIEHYIAWHRPDHYVVRLTAPFFADRFSSMNWSILTPDDSVSWNGHALMYGPGAPRTAAPADDELESLWRTYYGSIFNPARIKLKAMRREMPRRFWPLLPETTILDDLLQAAHARVQKMQSYAEGWEQSAIDFLPLQRDLNSLRAAASGCRGCPLHAPATRTVFGVGPPNAAIMIVGEQPGDEEDRIGAPFVGPAGQLLNQALGEAGLKREEVYLTNAVKHFKFEVRGKRRLHKKPNRREVVSCRAWLESELAAVRPQVLVCLGVTAAQTLAGPMFRLSDHLGKIFATDFCQHTLATYHPAAILRSSPEGAGAKRQQLVADLRRAGAFARKIK